MLESLTSFMDNDKVANAYKSMYKKQAVNESFMPNYDQQKFERLYNNAIKNHITPELKELVDYAKEQDAGYGPNDYIDIFSQLEKGKSFKDFIEDGGKIYIPSLKIK